MDNFEPLVSICVITYNSSKYVLETLESAKSQTYKNIELIISDDCSTDNTLEICKEWVENNKERFIDCKIIISDVNTGLPANCNRGCKAAIGDWIKSIAGDDILMPDCIKKNVDYILKNTNVEILHSSLLPFKDDLLESNCLPIRSFYSHPISRVGISAKEQFSILLRGCFINSPSVFMSRKLFDKVGGFDEEIKSIEDWPMWLKIVKTGIVIHCLNETTVCYRIHGLSICNESLNGRLFNSHYQREKAIYYKYIFPYLNLHDKLFLKYVFFLWDTFDNLGFNNKNLFNLLLYKFLLMPYSLHHRFINICNNYVYDIDRKVKRYENNVTKII